MVFLLPTREDTRYPLKPHTEQVWCFWLSRQVKRSKSIWLSERIEQISLSPLRMFQHHILKLHSGVMKLRKKGQHNTPHSPITYYIFCCYTSLSPRSPLQWLIRKATPQWCSPHLSCHCRTPALVHEPEDFGGWWHLIVADSLCKTIRKKPLDFLTRPSGFHLLKQHIWP